MSGSGPPDDTGTIGANAIASRATEYLDPRQVDDAMPPEDAEGRLTWLISGAGPPAVCGPGGFTAQSKYRVM